MAYNRRRNKNDSGGGLFLILIVIGIIFSMITFAPGIMVASIISRITPLTIGPLWGTTIIVTIIIGVALYYKQVENPFKRYFLIAIGVFTLGLVITLFDDTNNVYLTVKKMYPILERHKNTTKTNLDTNTDTTETNASR